MSEKSRGHSVRLINRACSVPLIVPVAELARVCFKEEIPVAYVARELEVTRATIYNWFTGATEPRPRHIPRIEKLAAYLSKGN